MKREQEECAVARAAWRWIPVAILAFSAGDAAFAAQETMYRIDAAHRGISPVAPLTSVKGVRWKFHTEGKVFSSPTLADGVVYVGSTDQNLYAIDLASGQERWHFATKGRVNSSPAVSGGKVIFESYDGTLYALDTKSGTVAWTFATAGEHRFTARHIHGALPEAEVMPDPFDDFLSSPIIVDGRVYFGSGDGKVYAVSLANGKLIWSFATGNVVHASPAYADGRVFVGSWDSWFYALDAKTGKLAWRFKTGEDTKIANQVGVQSSAVVTGGVVYFGCRDSQLYAVDEKSGRERWHYDNKGSWVIASPIVTSDRIYFMTSDSGLLHALSLSTREDQFALQLQWPTFSSPTLAGDMLYFGSNSGNLLAVDTIKGTIAWTFATEGARAHGAEYTKADGSPNYDVAFKSDFYDDLVAGVQQMFAIGSVLSSPALGEGVVVFGSSDGNVYALE